MTGAVGRAENKFSIARCMGEHLGCNPCGKVAGREQCHRLAGPGGAAVALAETTLDYTANPVLTLDRRLRRLFEHPPSGL
jgi:hypothetical protein